MERISRKLLLWYNKHGRHDLPWQQDITPYRVWVSEIMLQQTQVQTVIPYYQRFMNSFDNIHALAKASQDDVLHHWSGLGYYSRGRNLHRSAQIICEQYGGEFPIDIELIKQLPGIGPSTAGAICAIALGQRTPILDGNVKRVLTRLHAIAGWPDQRDVITELWQIADYHMSPSRPAAYTQAIMDLGATVCTRTKPKCHECPLTSVCEAYNTDTISLYPGKKPKKALPVKSTQMLMILDKQDNLLLIKRPPTGIWGGLWCFPQCAMDDNIKTWCHKQLGLKVNIIESMLEFRHTFSHYHLDIKPIIAKVSGHSGKCMDNAEQIWYNSMHTSPGGFAAPVKRLLKLMEQYQCPV